MAGGVAVINVGAATETMDERKKARVKTGCTATRAAVQVRDLPRRRGVLALHLGFRGC